LANPIGFFYLKTMDTIIKEISPVEATEMLKKNKGNRDVKEKHVLFLAKEMDSGNWLFDGQPIRLDKVGRVLDGQHRLNAVIRHGKPVKFLVINGIEQKAFKVMDTGMVRNAADVLSIKGYTSAAQVATTIRLIMTHEAGIISNKANIKPSNTDILEYLVKNPSIEDLVAKSWTLYKKFQKMLSVAQIASIKYITDSIDIVDSDHFWNGVCIGVNLDEGDPRKTLRDALINDKLSNRSVRYSHKKKMIFRAWNACRRGKSMKKFSFRKDEGIPELI